MSAKPPCLLTSKDFSILDVMLERCLGLDDPLRPILQRKLADATVVFHDDIPADVVTLNSRVRYRIDDKPSETRIVSHGEMRGLVGSFLPVTHPRGVALLGLAVGQSFALERREQGVECVHLLDVIYQPEASRREKAMLSGTASRLRLVHSSEPPSPPRDQPATAVPGYDDPGPSAA